MNSQIRKLGDKTYCIENPVNVGIYVLNDNNVCVIDTGSSKDYAKLIDKVLIDHNWNLKYIINTHSHADHISGNKYLQDKYKCKIYSSKIESYFINYPILEPSFLYGASPIKDLCSHFLYAPASICEDINDINIDGLSIINLEGHSLGLIGIVTSDEVCFVGDAYTSFEKIEKYAIQYTYDIDKFIDKLDFLLSTNYNIYVPAHGNVEKKEQAMNTIEKNKEVFLKLKEVIINLIGEKIEYSNLIKIIFDTFHIRINAIQYHLIGSTIRAYLKSLEKDNKIQIYYENNEMYIKSI